MTPKSLLRLPQATNRIEHLADTQFYPVLGEPRVPIDKVTRLDALHRQDLLRPRRRTRTAQGNEGVAIGRVELLYPFPEAQILELIDSYPNLARGRLGPGGAAQHGRPRAHVAAPDADPARAPRLRLHRPARARARRARATRPRTSPSRTASSAPRWTSSMPVSLYPTQDAGRAVAARPGASPPPLGSRARAVPERVGRCPGMTCRARSRSSPGGARGHRVRDRQALRGPRRHASWSSTSTRARRSARPRSSTTARALGIAADVTDRGAHAARGRDDASSASAGSTWSSPTPGIASRAATDAGDVAGDVRARHRGQPARRRRAPSSAALPEIVRRRGHVVVVASVYAFFNGVGAAPVRDGQGRGRAARPRAARRAGAARRERERRLLRLHRHRDGPPRDRRRPARRAR